MFWCKERSAFHVSHPYFYQINIYITVYICWFLYSWLRRFLLLFSFFFFFSSLSTIEQKIFWRAFLPTFFFSFRICQRCDSRQCRLIIQHKCLIQWKFVNRIFWRFLIFFVINLINSYEILIIFYVI